MSTQSRGMAECLKKMNTISKLDVIFCMLHHVQRTRTYLGTNHAFVYRNHRILSVAAIDVLTHCLFQYERFITMRTFVGTLAGMDHHVPFQNFLLDERSATIRTFERLLSWI